MLPVRNPLLNWLPRSATFLAGASFVVKVKETVECLLRIFSSSDAESIAVHVSVASPVSPFNFI
jgi:hypothetical protein